MTVRTFYACSVGTTNYHGSTGEHCGLIVSLFVWCSTAHQHKNAIGAENR